MKYLVALLTFFSVSFAQEKHGSCYFIQDSYLRVGPAYSYVWLTPQGNGTFSGNLYGVQAMYEYAPVHSIYQALKFAWKQGKTDHGLDSRSLLDFDAQQRVGYTFHSCDCCWEVTGFTGLGYRYLGHALKQPDFETVHFHYNEFYVPVGVLASINIACGWDLGLNMIWMPQVFPTLDIVPLGSAYWEIQRKVGNIRIEVPLIYSQCRKWFAELKPFFELWKDGKTVAETQIGIPLGNPENTYLFAGAELNIGLNF